MSNSLLYVGQGARDKFTKAAMIETRRDMERKIWALETKQNDLIDKLKESFDIDSFRNLNIVNHHIEVAKSRKRGEWMYGNYPEFATTSTTK
ncbi:MAG TPA: hypothetical protein VGK38_10500 [Prolixibacteraceae bacterium]|jgi:hypothetical protein